jgi:hypothetical protein
VSEKGVKKWNRAYRSGKGCETRERGVKKLEKGVKVEKKVIREKGGMKIWHQGK